MKRHTSFGLRHLVDEQRLQTALKRAEAMSSGEVRVSISPFFWGDVRKAAELAFDRLGMRRTRERNGVLFFVVPSRRQLVILGDEGIHQRVGQAFWDEVVADVVRHFKDEDFTGGLLAGIEKVAQKLAEHFPARAGDVNELPDVVDYSAPQG